MKMLKDKKIIALMSLLLVFTIVYFVAANNISYAFDNDSNINEVYSSTVEMIKKSAIMYAQKTPDIFKESKIVYIKVQDLINANYLIPDENGNIVNPLNENDTLNNNIIKLKSEDDKIVVEIDN